MTDTLAGLAAAQVKRDPPLAGEEAKVLSGGDTPSTPVHVELVSQPGVRHGPFPWVSNAGRLPARDDGCLVVHGLGERWVMVWATGSEAP